MRQRRGLIKAWDSASGDMDQLAGCSSGVTTTMNITLTAIFEPVPEGGYTCRFTELPEVFSQGETIEEARINLFDALELVLAYHRDQAEPQPDNGRVVRETFALQRAA